MFSPDSWLCPCRLWPWSPGSRSLRGPGWQIDRPRPLTDGAHPPSATVSPRCSAPLTPVRPVSNKSVARSDTTGPRPSLFQLASLFYFYHPEPYLACTPPQLAPTYLTCPTHPPYLHTNAYDTSGHPTTFDAPYNSSPATLSIKLSAAILHPLYHKHHRNWSSRLLCTWLHFAILAHGTPENHRSLETHRTQTPCLNITSTTTRTTSIPHRPPPPVTMVDGTAGNRECPSLKANHRSNNSAACEA